MTGTGEWDMQYLLAVQSVSALPHIQRPIPHGCIHSCENAPGNTPHTRTERRTDALKQILLSSGTDDEGVRPVKRDHTFDCVRDLARNEFDNDGELTPTIFEVGILLLDEPH